MNLVAPITLAAILDDAASKMGRKTWAGYLANLLEGLAGLVHLIDIIDDKWPKRLQIITKILKAIPLESLAKHAATELRTVHMDAKRRHDATGAVTAAMFEELSKAEGTSAYYRVRG